MQNFKVPFSTTQVLHNLYHCIDALKRQSIPEARSYILDSLVDAKNEAEWTLNTDSDLPSVINYLENLSNCLTILSTTTCPERVLPTIIEEIQGLSKSLEHLVSDTLSWQEPGTIDDLEKLHRRALHVSKK